MKNPTGIKLCISHKTATSRGPPLKSQCGQSAVSRQRRRSLSQWRRDSAAALPRSFSRFKVDWSGFAVSKAVAGWSKSLSQNFDLTATQQLDFGRSSCTGQRALAYATGPQKRGSLPSSILLFNCCVGEKQQHAAKQKVFGNWPFLWINSLLPRIRLS